jgi:hypothetical protein
VSNKKVTTKQKNTIQNSMWTKLGIKIERVLQGKGTSNIGNDGWQIFEHGDEVSKITGLDRRLLDQFKVILSILVSFKVVDAIKYDKYAKDTTKYLFETL